MNHDWSWN